jgi:hypothetical protein
MKKVKEISKESVSDKSVSDMIIAFIYLITTIKLADFETERMSEEEHVIYERGFQDCKDYVIDQLKKKGF